MTFPKTFVSQLAHLVTGMQTGLAYLQGLTYLQEHFTSVLLLNDFSLFNSCHLINLALSLSLYSLPYYQIISRNAKL